MCKHSGGCLLRENLAKSRISNIKNRWKKLKSQKFSTVTVRDHRTEAPTKFERAAITESWLKVYINLLLIAAMKPLKSWLSKSRKTLKK